MSLENLNLQEMSHQEMKETEGGLLGLLVGAILGFGMGALLLAIIREL